MGAKKTGELIPLCHVLCLTKVAVEFEMVGKRRTGIRRSGISGQSVLSGARERPE
ncbi:MAG: cyclic pyranopterin monophosphate synthase MoaC [Sellimonas intestinalis]